MHTSGAGPSNTWAVQQAGLVVSCCQAPTPHQLGELVSAQCGLCAVQHGRHSAVHEAAGGGHARAARDDQQRHTWSVLSCQPHGHAAKGSGHSKQGRRAATAELARALPAVAWPSGCGKACHSHLMSVKMTSKHAAMSITLSTAELAAAWRQHSTLPQAQG
jgi:hypothetical protein